LISNKEYCFEYDKENQNFVANFFIKQYEIEEIDLQFTFVGSDIRPYCSLAIPLLLSIYRDGSKLIFGQQKGQTINALSSCQRHYITEQKKDRMNSIGNKQRI